MIHGIGTDIVKLERFEEMHHRHGDRLVKHLLLPAEQVLFANSKRPARFLAMHWAAKEAIVKAMGTGFAEGMWIRDAGYVPNQAGKPEIVWSEQGQTVCKQLGIGAGHLTLTDEAGLIIAVAVLMTALE
ncbi:MAG: holo-ACP synthase [Steroidobacteraceae bacterium]